MPTDEQLASMEAVILKVLETSVFICVMDSQNPNISSDVRQSSGKLLESLCEFSESLNNYIQNIKEDEK